MSELEDAKRELLQALAPLQKSEQSDPLEDILRGVEKLQKATAASSSLMPGEGPGAEASKGNAGPRNKAVNQAKATRAEARGDSPRGGEDTRYGKHAEIDESDLPEEDEDEYLPNETAEQAALRGKSPKTKKIPAKTALTKAMQPDQEDPEEEEAEEEAEEQAQGKRQAPAPQEEDREEEPEEEEEEAPPQRPMGKSKAVASLGSAVEEEDLFKSIASHDTEGIYLETIDGSDALTYLTDEFVKSLAEVSAQAQANDEAIAQLVQTNAATLAKSMTKIKNDQAALSTKVDELVDGLVTLMKSQASLMTLFQTGTPIAAFSAPAQMVQGTQVAPGILPVGGVPLPVPTVPQQNKFFNQGQFMNLERFTVRREETPVAKSMTPLGVSPDLTRTAFQRTLEKAVSSNKLSPQYLSWIDTKGILGTLELIPAETRAELGL